MAQEHSQEERRAYRRALGAFATGVALISADSEKGVAGLIVNSFTSVSLEPRLVLWCLGNESDRFGIFFAAERWGVSFLAPAQQPLSDRLSRRGAGIDPEAEFERIGDTPVLRGAIGALACRMHDRIALGDHHLLVGEVTGYADAGGAALTYFRGAYGVADV